MPQEPLSCSSNSCWWLEAPGGCRQVGGGSSTWALDTCWRLGGGKASQRQPHTQTQPPAQGEEATPVPSLPHGAKSRGGQGWDQCPRNPRARPLRVRSVLELREGYPRAGEVSPEASPEAVTGRGLGVPARPPKPRTQKPGVQATEVPPRPSRTVCLALPGLSARLFQVCLPRSRKPSRLCAGSVAHTSPSGDWKGVPTLSDLQGRCPSALRPGAPWALRNTGAPCSPPKAPSDWGSLPSGRMASSQTGLALNSDPTGWLPSTAPKGRLWGRDKESLARPPWEGDRTLWFT